MKKKYTPAEIEMILVGTCDVITTSLIEPPEQEEPGEGGGDAGGTGSSGSGIGGNWNQAGWI